MRIGKVVSSNNICTTYSSPPMPLAHSSQRTRHFNVPISRSAPLEKGRYRTGSSFFLEIPVQSKKGARGVMPIFVQERRSSAGGDGYRENSGGGSPVSFLLRIGIDTCRLLYKETRVRYLCTRFPIAWFIIADGFVCTCLPNSHSHSTSSAFSPNSLTRAALTLSWAWLDRWRMWCGAYVL